MFVQTSGSRNLFKETSNLQGDTNDDADDDDDDDDDDYINDDEYDNNNNNSVSLIKPLYQPIKSAVE